MNSSTNLRKPGKFVNAPVMKKDAMALVTGKPVYTTVQERKVYKGLSTF